MSPKIYVVLVEPEKPGNIGAVARVMMNFGLDRLVLVNPRCDHLSKDALDRASHAKDVLKKAKIRDLSCIDEFDYAVGTTSKLGTDYNLPRSPVSPAQLAEKISGLGAKAKIALLFGRESSGLTNNEIKKCDFLVTIPTSKKYPSMNLSHSAAVVLYEIFSKTGKDKIGEQINPITDAEKKQILRMVNETLDSIDFSTKEKKETQKVLWGHIVGKSFMTKREAYALMGFFRKILFLLKHKQN